MKDDILAGIVIVGFALAQAVMAVYLVAGLAY
jgi:hypothetical protein